MESHKNLLDSMEHWIQQDASLLAMTNEVDYDQDGETEFGLVLYMYSTVLSVHSVLHSEYCTVHNTVHIVLYSEYCTVHNTVHIVQCILYSAQYSAVHIVQCTVHCTFHSLSVFLETKFIFRKYSSLDICNFLSVLCYQWVQGTRASSF